jgi:hypothetical protein
MKFIWSLPLRSAWFHGVGEADKLSTALACHPDHITIHAAVQVAAAAVLLYEGIESGE